MAVLGLGSNVGDRMAHLQSAVDALDKHRDVDVLGVSPVYETEPVGGPGPGPVPQRGREIATLLDPRDLLTLAHELEDARGRERAEHWGPRTLDVDLLTFQSYFAQTERADAAAPARARARVRARALVRPRPGRRAARQGSGALRCSQQVPRSGVQRRDDLHLLFVGAGDSRTRDARPGSGCCRASPSSSAC